MKKFESVDDALEFAISNEIRANLFYLDLAERMDRPAMKEVFLEFAAEEKNHEQLLREVQAGRKLEPAASKVTDLMIGNYLVDAEASPGMSYQEALILAIKREHAAQQLYIDLAASTADGGLKQLFEELAQQEARHKLRFETEYDENVFKEN